MEKTTELHGESRKEDGRGLRYIGEEGGKKKKGKRKRPVNYLCPTQQRRQCKKSSLAAPATKVALTHLNQKAKGVRAGQLTGMKVSGWILLMSRKRMSARSISSESLHDEGDEVGMNRSSSS